MRSQSASYHGYRFLPDIISHAVWLYHRFCLSFHDAEDLLAQRGVTVTYETIRQWCQRFGPVYARRLRRRHARVNAGGSLEPAPLSRVASGRAVVAGFPDVLARMQPSDSRPPVGPGSGRPWPVAYPVPLRQGGRRASQVPGPSSSSVPQAQTPLGARLGLPIASRPPSPSGCTMPWAPRMSVISWL